MTRRDWLIIAAALLGPFVSTAWSYKYWDALRHHMAWIAGLAAPTDGSGVLAGIVTFGAHVFAVAYYGTKKGWFP
ncbi:MAG TPA: hypothetical protein VGK73_08940 [Polyangiaceae bacterium]